MTDDYDEENYKELQIIPGYIYIIKGIETEGGYYVKIGQTKHDPTRRFKSIKNNVPFKTELYAQFWTEDRMNLEQDFFNQLHKWRVNGEWFILPEWAIKGICDSHAKHHPREEDEEVIR